MSIEHRRSPRVPFTVEVTLESDNNFFAGVTNNISEGGVFIASAAPPPVGSEVAFDLVLGDDRFPVVGVVCWLRDERAASPGAPAGCGVRWHHLDDAALAAIQRFTLARQADLYEE